MTVIALISYSSPFKILISNGCIMSMRIQPNMGTAMLQRDLLLNPLPDKARTIARQPIPFEHFFAPPLYYFNKGPHQILDENLQKNGYILESNAKTNRHFYHELMLCKQGQYKRALRRIDHEISLQNRDLESAQLSKTISNYTYLCYFNCLKATCHFMLADYSAAMETFYTVYSACEKHNALNSEHHKFSWDISAWALIMRARCILCLSEKNVQDAITDLRKSSEKIITFQALTAEKYVNSSLAHALLNDRKECEQEYKSACGFFSKHYLLNDLKTLV